MKQCIDLCAVSLHVASKTELHFPGLFSFAASHVNCCLSCVPTILWSLCHISQTQSSISAYETSTPHWSHKFHPHLCTNWRLQIFVLSTYTSRLEHSVCWSPSQVLVVCKRVSWSGRLSHDTPAVNGDVHCWIFAEELKKKKKNHCIACNLPLPTLSAIICWHLPHHRPRDGYPVDSTNCCLMM